MAYIFTPRYDISQQWKAQSIINKGIKAELSSAKIISNIGEAGLSYRRQNMLHDIRRGRAVEFSKSPVTKLKAENWFDSVYEPFRAERKITSNEASDIWSKTIQKTLEIIELDEEEDKFWRQYQLAFEAE